VKFVLHYVESPQQLSKCRILLYLSQQKRHQAKELLPGQKWNVDGEGDFERQYRNQPLLALFSRGCPYMLFTINPNDLTNEINMKLTAFGG
jgi:hypothetical protein